MTQDQDKGNAAPEVQSDNAALSLANSLLLDQQLCFPLYATSRQMTRLYGTLLEPIGITYPQYLVLMVLWENAPRTVMEIGQELQLNTNTLTPLLKRLEDAKIIQRTRSKKDERIVQITLTSKGHDLRQACLVVPAMLIASLHFDSAKAIQLRELLRELNSKLTAAIAQTNSSLAESGP